MNACFEPANQMVVDLPPLYQWKLKWKSYLLFFTYSESINNELTYCEYLAFGSYEDTVRLWTRVLGLYIDHCHAKTKVST